MSDMIETINSHLLNMDVPLGKRDCAKHETVKWLLLNLGTRNKKHPQYRTVMQYLISTAKKYSILRAKEIAAIEAALG